MNNDDEQHIAAAMLRMWLADEASVNMAQEKTLLEDGTKIGHHREDQCEGNCCLHGTSIYRQCKQPRTWRSLRRHIEHRCPCGIGHPCGCYIDYSGDDGVHGCCGVDGHCPVIPFDATRVEGVEELEPEPEPVDPLKGLRITASAHDYLINILAKNQRDSAKTQERLANRVVNMMDHIGKLERMLYLLYFLAAGGFGATAYALYLLGQR